MLRWLPEVLLGCNGLELDSLQYYLVVKIFISGLSVYYVLRPEFHI